MTSIDTCNALLKIELPKKKKYVRDNQLLFINKTLPQKSMLRTRLRNTFLRNRTEEK